MREINIVGRNTAPAIIFWRPVSLEKENNLTFLADHEISNKNFHNH